MSYNKKFKIDLVPLSKDRERYKASAIELGKKQNEKVDNKRFSPLDLCGGDSIVSSSPAVSKKGMGSPKPCRTDERILKKKKVLFAKPNPQLPRSLMIAKYTLNEKKKQELEDDVSEVSLISNREEEEISEVSLISKRQKIDAMEDISEVSFRSQNQGDVDVISSNLSCSPQKVVTFLSYYEEDESSSARENRATSWFLFEWRKTSIDSKQHFLSYNIFQEFQTKRDAMMEIWKNIDLYGGGFVPLFAVQTGTGMNLKYIVSGYQVFQKSYFAMAKEDRCFYEMIQSFPIKPFCDYDSTEDVMTVDEFEEKVQVLNQIIVSKLKKRSPEISSVEVLNLKSSSKEKFSTHSIFLPTDGNKNPVLFKNVYHLKVFMEYIRCEAEQKHKHWISEKSRNVFGVLDMSPYKEGAFRLYGSTKKGKDRYLVHECCDELSSDMFYSSLLQYFEGIPSLVYCQMKEQPIVSTKDPKQQQIRILPKFRDNDSFFKARSGINSLQKNILQRILEYALNENEEEREAYASVCKRWFQLIQGSWPASKPDPVLIGSLSQLLKSHLRNDEQLRGQIMYFEGSFGRCYVIGTNSRNCEMNWEIKKRDHLKNTVYYVFLIDLRVFYQKCHDVDCKGYLLEGHKRERFEIQSLGTFGGAFVDGFFGDKTELIGKGKVREIPQSFLFPRVFENEREDVFTPYIVVLKLYNNSKTIFSEKDFVSYNDKEYYLRKVEQDRMILRNGEEKIVVCEKDFKDLTLIIGKKMREEMEEEEEEEQEMEEEEEEKFGFFKKQMFSPKKVHNFYESSQSQSLLSLMLSDK